MYFITVIEAAGWPIWTIISTSIIALAIILERLYTLRSAHILPKGTLAHLLTLGSTVEGVTARPHSPLGQVLAVAARYAHQPFAQAKEAIENTGHHVAHQLNRYLNTLGTIAAIAPLLGLLGTVIGMIDIFAAQTPNGSNPAVLAQGISVALYNTAFGIIVAVPSLMFYRYFRSQVAGFLLEMEYQAFQLIEALTQTAREEQ
jgi:biopolymer transport protein ExbB